MRQKSARLNLLFLVEESIRFNLYSSMCIYVELIIFYSIFFPLQKTFTNHADADAGGDVDGDGDVILGSVARWHTSYRNK